MAEKKDPKKNGLDQEKDEAARRLAQKHREVEVGITHILRFTDRAEVEALQTEPIKLLEVNANTVPSGVMPLRFGAAPSIGVPFPTVIVEVTPDEFQKIQAKELKLPSGWLDSYEIAPEAFVQHCKELLPLSASHRRSPQ